MEIKVAGTCDLVAFKCLASTRHINFLVYVYIDCRNDKVNVEKEYRTHRKYIM